MCFLLVNGLNDDRSHVLFDVERVQVDHNGSIKTYDLASVGPAIDSAFYTFFEDLYTKDDNTFTVPESFAQSHFAIPDTLANHNPSNVTDFTFISKNFEDMKFSQCP